MILVKIPENIIISKDIFNAEKLIDKFFGKIKLKNEGILFQTRWGIHTAFLKQSIDILVLNDNLKIMCIKSELKPFSIFFWNPKYQFVIELPVGFISKFKLNTGMRLKIV